MESYSLTPRELRIYKRQIMIAEVGLEGQEKLKNARVLVVGAGGLGCPVLQYLTAAGTGKIGIVEFDTVEESNLQRQVLYGSMDVGKLKGIIAKNRLEQMNTLVNIEIFNLRFDASNALGIIRQFDIVVDATDNWDVRYVINDACVILNKPMVHGAIFKFEGEVSVFNFKGGSTYRCFNPCKEKEIYENPEPTEMGLMGVLPGITGTLMANEVIKIITGGAGVLSGKLLIFNILNYSFRTITITNVPENHNIREIKAEC